MPEVSLENTAIDFASPMMLSAELLEKQRKEFMRVRQILRVPAVGLIIVLLAVLTVSLVDGTFVRLWFVLPSLGFLLWLFATLERIRFCRDCSWRITSPILERSPPLCPNCGRLLDAAQILMDPPGTLNLNDERYCSDAQPAVKLISMVLLLSIKDRASEVRFEPGRDALGLQYRCGGEVFDMAPAPAFLNKSIVGILKAMAGRDPDQRRQTGRMELKVDSHNLTALVATEPCEFGENVMLLLPDNADAAGPAGRLLQKFVSAK